MDSDNDYFSGEEDGRMEGVDERYHGVTFGPSFSHSPHF